jgi:hypothetical protein
VCPTGIDFVKFESENKLETDPTMAGFGEKQNDTALASIYSALFTAIHALI